MIIAFTGEWGSGKDFLTDHLVNTQNAIRLSFSDQVRRLAVSVFPWLPFHFDPSIKDSTFVHELNPNGMTPREIWLLIGKVRDVTPSYFLDSFLTDPLVQRALDPMNPTLYIITDLRTEQEYDWVKSNKIPLIKIELEERIGMPESKFEEFVRNIKDADGFFINKLDGTDRFDRFFNRFVEKVISNHE